MSALDDDIQRVPFKLAAIFRRARTYARGQRPSVHPNVTPAQYSVIAHLVDIGPARAAELTDLFRHRHGRDQPPAGPSRGPGPGVKDARPVGPRALVVTATAEARRRYLVAKQERRGPVLELLRDTQPEDVRLLADLLARFNAAHSWHGARKVGAFSVAVRTFGTTARAPAD